MPSKVVIVESPSKAKTLGKYLGKDFQVLASYGHVRDLPSKNGSVIPDQDFALIWEVTPSGSKHMKDIEKAARQAQEVYLATDPDREGEAIAWHVWSILQEKIPASKQPTFKRAVFHEITKQAVLHAIHHPRSLDQHLIDACLARRALDYLVGFTLSPILWRKLPGSRSAGRVQSVALKLLTDREKEIEAFQSKEYWTIHGFLHKDALGLEARVDWFDGHKVSKFSIPDQKTSEEWVQALQKAQTYTVSSLEKTQARRHPSPPFTTSTLQQEAAKRGLSVSRVMQIAQNLYEGVDLGGETIGLITYMRTDSVQMASEAVQQARTWVKDTWGASYVPEEIRVYKSKQKNVQEAHEAIRPTLFSRDPESLRSYLTVDQWKVYDLIWKRAMASQMSSALFDQVTIDLRDPSGQMGFRATGSTLVFDGFLKLYRDADDEDAEDENLAGLLPPFRQGDQLTLQELNPKQHFTQPPPRYTEATLVKKMEELGIGRPSTYASILHVLQDRKYARLEQKRFIPESRGRLVTAFLENYFKTYVEYGFTADLEDKLDHISEGEQTWKVVLKEFWKDFLAATQETEHLRIKEVLDVLENDLKPILFPEPAEGEGNPRQCPQCSEGQLSLKLGKFGAFVGCSRYPDCRYTRPLSPQDEDAEVTISADPSPLGQDPETHQPIFLKRGPYGFYIQRGDKEDLKRVPVPKFMSPAQVDLQQAIGLLRLPREVGPHPLTGEPIYVGIGRYGPYVKYQSKFHKLSMPEALFTLTPEEACTMIVDAPEGAKKARVTKAKPSARTASKTTKAAPKKTAAKKASPKKTPKPKT